MRGATLVTGGTGRPEGLKKGYYVKPTVFANVTNNMTIAREEIFGPVLAILGYDSVDHAIEIANDTEYGLAGYVAGADLEKARAVARKIRSGWVVVNDGFDWNAPFGGYKKSGNGREWGEFGFHEYVETKAILGYAPNPGCAVRGLRRFDKKRCSNDGYAHGVHPLRRCPSARRFTGAVGALRW